MAMKGSHHNSFLRVKVMGEFLVRGRYRGAWFWVYTVMKLVLTLELSFNLIPTSFLLWKMNAACKTLVKFVFKSYFFPLWGQWTEYGQGEHEVKGGFKLCGVGVYVQQKGGFKIVSMRRNPTLSPPHSGEPCKLQLNCCEKFDKRTNKLS